MIDEEASAVMREDREDGEFWMEIGDFVRFFSKACIGFQFFFVLDFSGGDPQNY